MLMIGESLIVINYWLGCVLLPSPPPHLPVDYNRDGLINIDDDSQRYLSLVYNIDNTLLLSNDMFWVTD